jgi:hypothetical protein
MKKFSDNNEWFIARRKLASALGNSEEIKITGFKKFLNKRNEFIPLLDDIIKFSSDFSFAEISFDNEDLVFHPEKITAGDYNFESGNYSSISEILLYVLPALSSCNSKSVLSMKGVTNSSLSYPAVFLKDVLFKNVISKGISIDLTTSALGFYGRGGGAVRAVINSDEKKAVQVKSDIPDEMKLSLKILFSGSDSTLALHVRDLMENVFPELIGSGIMEVDSPALAAWIYLHLVSAEKPLIFFREIPFYNHSGDLIFDYDSIDDLVSGLRMEYEDYIYNGKLPYDIDAELVVFL